MQGIKVKMPRLWSGLGRQERAEDEDCGKIRIQDSEAGKNDLTSYDEVNGFDYHTFSQRLVNRIFASA